MSRWRREARSARARWSIIRACGRGRPATPPSKPISFYVTGISRYWNIKDRRPVLNRLKQKTAQDQPYSEHAQAPLGKVVRVILDVGIDDRAHSRHQTGHQSKPNGE